VKLRLHRLDLTKPRPTETPGKHLIGPAPLMGHLRAICTPIPIQPEQRKGQPLHPSPTDGRVDGFSGVEINALVKVGKLKNQSSAGLQDAKPLSCNVRSLPDLEVFKDMDRRDFIGVTVFKGKFPKVADYISIGQEVTIDVSIPMLVFWTAAEMKSYHLWPIACGENSLSTFSCALLMSGITFC